MQLYHALHPLTSQYAPVYPYTPSQARQLYHATRDAGLSREQIKTFSRRLHWRAPASLQLVLPIPWPLAQLSAPPVP